MYAAMGGFDDLAVRLASMGASITRYDRGWKGQPPQNALQYARQGRENALIQNLPERLTTAVSKKIRHKMYTYLQGVPPIHKYLPKCTIGRYTYV